ncbi:MAG: hypothetical protein M1833_005101 [Piccolia ochrophora]|nr:MAG: hypothetical protein M1833_005101 [Piccolia ochrophora]
MTTPRGLLSSQLFLNRIQQGTLLPILYQTRTLQRPWPSSRTTLQQKPSRSFTQTTFSRKPDSNPGNHNPSLTHPSLTSADDPPVPASDRISTITPSERATFRRIFSEIISSTKPPSPGQTSSASALFDEEDEDDDDEFLPDGDETLDSIFATATRYPATNNDRRPHRRRPRDERNDLSFDPTSTTNDADLARYPPALRSYASRASRAVRHELASRATDSAADPELARIETLLTSATTDIELWTVLEREVFSMIPPLEALLASPPHESETAKPPRRRGGGRPRRKAVSSSPSAGEGDPSSSSSSAEEQTPPPPPNDATTITTTTTLPATTHLYAPLLLLATRLLASPHFSSPTLALAVFRHVKALGALSRVLGGTAALYNEVMLVTWRVYGDAHGVAALLAEMERGGLAFDEGTRDVLEEVSGGWRDGGVQAGMEPARSGVARVERWKGRVWGVGGLGGRGGGMGEEIAVA